MATAKLLAADVQDALGLSDEGVRDLVRRGLLHPQKVGLRSPINVYDAAEVEKLAGRRMSGAFDALCVRERAKGAKASARVDRALRQGRMFMSGRELLRRSKAGETE